MATVKMLLIVSVSNRGGIREISRKPIELEKRGRYLVNKAKDLAFDAKTLARTRGTRERNYHYKIEPLPAEQGD